MAELPPGLESLRSVGAGVGEAAAEGTPCEAEAEPDKPPEVGRGVQKVSLLRWAAAL